MIGKKLKRTLVCALTLTMLLPTLPVYANGSAKAAYADEKNGSAVINTTDSESEIAAASEIYGDFEYTVENGNAAITGYSGAGGDVEVPSEIGGYPVTDIKYSAFEGCFLLTSIRIPESVTSIDSGSFSMCSSLSEINVADGNTSYSSENGVLFNKEKTELICCPEGKSGNYTVPDTVTSIHGNAFFDCRLLTSVTVPKGVTRISALTFYSCTSLTSVTLPDGLVSIGDYAFCDCSALTTIVIPDTVTFIGSNAFYYCTSLTEITIPKGLTSIERSIFYYCSSLVNVTIPEGVTSIGDNAFGSCSSLESVVIPASVTSIGYYAFDACTSLIRIVIPDSVTFIGSGAFFGCSSLSDIELGDGLTSIGDIAFEDTAYSNDESNWTDGVLYIGNYLIKANASISGEYTVNGGVKVIADSAFSSCELLTSVNFPNSLTYIGESAFIFCSSLTGIAVPESVKIIGDMAFYGCTSLAEISIPDGLEYISGFSFYYTSYYNDESNWEDSVLYIGKYLIKANSSLSGKYTVKEGTKLISGSAFSFCNSVTEITVPDSVTSIEYRAFYGCESLMSVSVPSSVKRIGEGSFDDCDSLTDIYYSGRHSEWNEITVKPSDGDSWLMKNDEGRTIPKGVTVHFSIDDVLPSTDVPGDADGDGVLTNGDVTRVMRYLAGVIGQDGLSMAGADANGDGEVNNADITRIMRILAGLAA